MTKSARRRSTENRLIEAVEALMKREGFHAMGVNAIAREAGVNKVLIYRYFGDLEGLYRAYGDQADFWPTHEEMLAGLPEGPWTDNPEEVAATILGNFARGLQRRPLTLELLAWECTDRNPLTIALEEVRERRSMELGPILQSRGLGGNPNMRVAITFLSASINYLSIRRRNIRYFNGVDIQEKETWEELPALIALMLRGITNKAPT